MISFLYTLIFLLLIIYLFIKHKYRYWKRRNVPYPEPEFIYGNTRGFGKKFYHGELWKKVYENFKTKTPIAGIYVLIDPCAVVTDLDLVRNILVKDFNVFPNRGQYHNEKDDPISAHLVNIEDDKWRNLRTKLTPTFTSGKLKLMFPIIVQVVDNMLEKISKEAQITAQLEVKDILSRLTTDVIGKIAFGIECNSLNDKDSKFYRIGLKAFGTRNILKRLLISRYQNLARKLHVRTSNPEVANFYRDIVDQTIKYREENNIESNDFMGLLIKMKNNSVDPITFNEIWAQSTVFFLAGYETSATTLTYSMYELSIHKDLQRKARENVRKVLEKHNGEFTYEAVNEMQYVEQCINGMKTYCGFIKHSRFFSLFKIE
jgi:cytochrome P450 family 6